MPTFQVIGLTELKQRMTAYPAEYDKAAEIGTRASILALQEHVPAYPPPPSTSTHRRTGLLGRSLGAGQSGGIIGSPSIFKAEKVGGDWRGEFGSNVRYAPRVIGEQQQQPWASYWWNIKTILTAATPKIEQIWLLVGEKLGKFLDGR